MKKYIALAVCFFSISQFCQAQKSDNSSRLNAVVPQVVIESFSKDYSGINAKWDKENANYEANFKKNGKSISVLYDATGTKLETEEDIPVTSLLQSVHDYVASHYNGKKIQEAAIITRPNGEVNFEAEVDGMDLLFTKQGQFIKAVKD
ncbi:MAG: PepSY-like domain-containing protein [Ginsengibacter sp.]